MLPQRQVWVWVFAAIGALAFLGGTLVWERQSINESVASVHQNDPQLNMWNHAPNMAAAMQGSRVPWPSFEGSEMTDLTAYLRSVKGEPRRGFSLLGGDPQRGRELFRKKGCAKCHAAEGHGGTVGPDLGSKRAPRVGK